jgi:NodT family efflux transporter outer membrane factor (OMF) lipoprotein
MKLLVLIINLIFLSSCSLVGPNYDGAPELDLPQSWNHKLGEDFVAGDIDLTEWWKNLSDPILDELIKEASKDNLNIRMAISRVEEARGNFGIVDSLRFPQLDLEGSVKRSKTSESASYTSSITDTYSTLGLDLGWEIDVFGFVRRSVEAADAEIDASVEYYRDVMVVLYSEIAKSYVSARTYQARLQFANDNVKNQKETVGIVAARYEAELVSEIDVFQSKQNLAASEAAIPLLNASLDRTINRLAVLLGKKPGYLQDKLLQPKAIPQPPQKITLFLPAEILRQRPDIRQAERDLAAQTARIGITVAEMYPRFSLGGTIGISKASDNSGNTEYYSFGPSFTWEVFDAGRHEAEIKVQDERLEQARASYEKTVLTALEEVENALTAYNEEQYRIQKIKNSVDASKNVNEITRARYSAGLIDFQEVLDAQRVVFNQEDDLATSQGELIQHLIDIYWSMGGGWDETQLGIRDEDKPE